MQLQTQALGASSVQTTRIVYGCMPLGGGWDDSAITGTQRAKAITAVHAAVDAGITCFDHADIYCRGKSETVFAEALRELGIARDRLVLQSKCGIRFPDPAAGIPHRFDFSREHITASVEAILKRLGTDRLDVLLLHRPDALVEPEEVAAAFDGLERAGKVRHFGVSNHHVHQLELLRRHVRQPLVANQLELSLVHSHLIDAAIDANRQQAPFGADGTLDYCRLHGITVQAWAPLARGKAVGGDGDARAIALKKAVDAVAARHGVEAEAVAVAWLLRHPARIQPVIGSTDPKRIAAACQADRVKLSREEWYGLYIAGRGKGLP